MLLLLGLIGAEGEDLKGSDAPKRSPDLMRSCQVSKERWEGC